MTSPSQPADDDPRAWIGSCVGWLWLFTAAAIYAVVVLAPKQVALEKLRGEYQLNQLRLVSLEQQVQRMDQVAALLEHDPEFTAALARVDFETTLPGERIPVPPELALDVRSAEVTPTEAVPLATPWYLPALEYVAQHRGCASGLLATAAVLAFGAFVIGPGGWRFPLGRLTATRCLNFLRERYRLSP